MWGVNCTTLPRRSYSFEIATIFWMSQLLFTSLLEVLQLLIKIKSSAVVFLNRKLQFILLQSTSLKLASIKDIMHETLVITIDDITRYVSAVLAFQKAVISLWKIGSTYPLSTPYWMIGWMSILIKKGLYLQATSYWSIWHKYLINCIFLWISHHGKKGIKFGKFFCRDHTKIIKF